MTSTTAITIERMRAHLRILLTRGKTRLCANSVFACAAGCLLLGLTGCASGPEPAHESWIPPRPLGKEFERYHPPQEPTHAPAPPVKVEEPTGMLTLRQVLALALMHNPELAAFSWEVRAGEARTLQASLRPNPEVAVGSEHFGGTGEVRGTGAAETTFAFGQLIETAGKRAKRTRVASLERDLAGWSYESKRLDVLTEATAAFVDVLAVQQRLALLQELAELALKVRDTMAERVTAGKSSPAEVMRAGVALANTRVEVQHAERELELTHKRLGAAWGSTNVSFDRVEGELTTVKPIPTDEQLATLVSQNPDVARWVTEMEERRAVLELEKARRIPDFTLGAGPRYYSASSDVGFLAGVSVPLPLFNRNQGAIREARYRVSQAEDEQKAAALRAHKALLTAYQALSVAYVEANSLQKDVLPLAQQAYEATNERYLQGKFGFVDVLDAQRALFEARQHYIEALGAYHKAVAEVERLIGQSLDSVPVTSEHK